MNHIFQSHGLIQGSWKAIEQQGLSIIQMRSGICHNKVDHEFIRHKLSIVHVLLGFFSKGSAFSNLLAQNIPRRNVVKFGKVLLSDEER
jgi:hypothetical protein